MSLDEFQAYLGLPATRLPDHPWRHHRQADTLTDKWVERYHALKDR
jgi:LPS sulfotransferase NodH